jgi:hydrogenase maturation protease
MTLTVGSRVRLRPRPGGDIMDIALAGRTAVIDGIEETLEGGRLLAVVVEDDPGRGEWGHRFFFAPEEVEPMPMRVLVAGIGNVFLADDGFGVVLADRLGRQQWPAGVQVADFGIRGMDLAYTLLDGWDAAILLDAAPRGEAPGTLYVIEPELDAADVAPEAHGMDPVTVLALARSLGGTPPRTLVLGCEPRTRMTEDDEIDAELTEPVRAALDEAERLFASLLDDLMRGGPQ